MKKVLITGTSRGLGYEFTKRYLEEGASVWAVSRNKEGLMDLQRKFPQQLHLIHADIAHPELKFQFVNANLPALDLVISNAGILGENMAFSNLSLLGDIQKVFEVNLKGSINVIQSLLSLLKKDAKIVHITSLMGSIQENRSGGHYAYRISKAALNMFNKSFSKDYPDWTSVVLHPGWVKTDMGGAEAPLEIAESVAGMMDVISSLTPPSSGRFFDYKGKELPF